MTDATLQAQEALPIGSAGHRASGWFGMWTLVLTELSLFGYLLFSYAYVGLQARAGWPPGGPPSLRLALPNTVVLLASSLVLWFGESGMRRGHGSRTRTLAGIGLAILLGAAFVAVQALEWRDKPFAFGSSLYASFYFTITGVHIAHVLAGLAVLVALFGWTAAGTFSHRRHAALTIGALYWHFVDVVWLAIFTALYLAPRWGAA